MAPHAPDLGHDNAGVAAGRHWTHDDRRLSRAIAHQARSHLWACVPSALILFSFLRGETRYRSRAWGFIPRAQVDAFAFDPKAHQERNGHRGASRDDRQNRRVVAAMVFGIPRLNRRVDGREKVAKLVNKARERSAYVGRGELVEMNRNDA